MKFIDIHTHKSHSQKDFTIINIRWSNNWASEITPSKQAFSIGLHPWDATEEEIETLDWSKLEELAKASNIYLIGETGLDLSKRENLEAQKKAFARQIELSKKLQIPLLIHSVKGLNGIIQARKEHHIKHPWIIHDFNGGKEDIQSALTNDLYLCLGKNLMREKSKIVQNIEWVDLKKIFFETDENDYNIGDVYKRYCDLTQKNLEDVAQQVEENFKRFFSLKSLPSY